MPNGPLPGVLEPPPVAPTSDLDQWIDRMYLASQNPDNAIWDKAQHETAQAYLRTPDGLQFQQQADHLNGVWDRSGKRSSATSAQQAVQRRRNRASVDRPTGMWRWKFLVPKTLMRFGRHWPN